MPESYTAWYYRTGAGAEIDLVIEKDAKTRYAIEIKRSMTPTVSKGFHLGSEDIEATKRYIVYPGKERVPVGKGIAAISIIDMIKELEAM